MAEQNEPVFSIQRVYLRDMSLEIPHAPEIFLENGQPSVDVSLGVETTQLNEGLYDASVTVTVTTKIEEKVMFLCEGKQGGIFEIQNIPEDQLPMLLNVVCPNIIYPYLRSNIADTIQRTGFPPVHLAEINFEALYQQRLAEEAGEGDTDSPAIIVPPGVQ